MEEHINLGEKTSKSNYWKFVGAFLAIMLVVAGGYLVWDKNFSQEAETQKNYDKYLTWEEKYQEAMKNDTYGGKTPQETLDLFVEALRAEDVELASKYFVLNTNGEVDEKWTIYLSDMQKEDLLQSMARDIERDARPLKASYKDDDSFALFNDDGTVGVLIDMEINKESGVWKIESL